MTDALLRSLNVPWWVPFVVWFGGYFFLTFWHVTNGYTRQLFGSPLPHMGKIHKVIVRFHTGAHVQPEKSYGDERRLKRAAGATSRATPEGAMVYWSPKSQRFRAVRNNVATVIALTVLSTMVDDPIDTVRAVTLFFLVLAGLWIYLNVRRLRKKHAAARPLSPKPVAATKRAKLVMGADESTAGATPRLEPEDAAPQLEGVPANVLAALLSGKMGCSTAEVLNRMTLNADQGQLILPDTYTAVVKGREEVQDLIEAHTVGKVKFTWLTTQTPRTLTWVPVIEHSLPSYVRFRDYLTQIEALGPREFGIGAVASKDLFAYDHNGDNPWWCRFAGSGTGKSMGFLVKAAQICHKDPKADVYCIDTKQISFEHLHGIPGVHIFDNPVTGMGDIWNTFYKINGIITERYTAVREGRARLTDFNDVWLLVDEGNHLGSKIKSYAQDTLNESSTPRIWWEAIAPILQQGRQVRVFGEWMFQDLTDRAMGGQSLKFAFNTFGAAGFLPNQFTRTIGGKAEEALEGPGKILMCRGKRRNWVQGFADDEQWLHDYALENRKELAA